MDQTENLDQPYVFDELETKTVYGEGKYAKQWFKLRASITFDDLMKIYGKSDIAPQEQTALLAITMLVEWSIKKKDGTPVEISMENFVKLPLPMIRPLINAINGEDFLGQLSA